MATADSICDRPERASCSSWTSIRTRTSAGAPAFAKRSMPRAYRSQISSARLSWRRANAAIDEDTSSRRQGPRAHPPDPCRYSPFYRRGGPLRQGACRAFDRAPGTQRILRARSRGAGQRTEPDRAGLRLLRPDADDGWRLGPLLDCRRSHPAGTGIWTTAAEVRRERSTATARPDAADRDLLKGKLWAHFEVLPT